MCLAFNHAYVIAIRLNNDPTGELQKIYLSNEPATYHTTVATMTSAANTSVTNTPRSTLPRVPGIKVE